MLEYNGQNEDARCNLERLAKDSVVTGNPHRAEKLTTWVYRVMYHNAERVNKHEISLAEGWLNHKALCQECSAFGLNRGEVFEEGEYLSIIQKVKDDV